ncbi:hypothetical protein GYMLUDRAFT_71332 [Collybiopsis luxurians FD-317 M1]|nr:hypothetical protein GYMLUDRAFT_71332 [Collybiopsis luxurians FD-317 M1]
MHSLKTCQGVSLKTQALYLIVFVARYHDIFTVYISSYNLFGKLFFIASACYIVYLTRFRFRETYDAALDRVSLWRLIVPCAFFAVSIPLVTSHVAPRFGLIGAQLMYSVDTSALWNFSLFLEAIAIIPQIYMLR